MTETVKVKDGKVSCPDCGFVFTVENSAPAPLNTRLQELRSEKLDYWKQGAKLSPHWNKSIRETWVYDLSTRLNMIVAEAIYQTTLITDEFLKEVKL